MKIAFFLASLVAFTAAARAASPARVEKDYTVQWRQRVDTIEQPTPSVRVGAECEIRPLPKAKPSDAATAALFIGQHRSKTLIFPGKWYHFAIVGKGRQTQLFVNGFPDGEPFAHPGSGEVSSSASVPESDVQISQQAMSSEDVLAAFKSKLTQREIKTIAHRGVHKHAPENTRISYVQALEAGAPIVEFDTALTRDGHIVGMHDKTVNRTTDGTGPIADLTLAQVRKLDAGSWKHANYKGEPVPTIDDVADLCRGKAVLMLDLKAEGQGRAIADWLEKSKFPRDGVILAPWEDAEGVALRQHVKDVAMIRLTSKLPSEVIDDAYFAKMKSIGFSGFSVNWQHLTVPFVDAAKASGMTVYVWTLNDAPDVAGAVLLNVDGIITDDSAATIELVRELVGTTASPTRGATATTPTTPDAATK